MEMKDGVPEVVGFMGLGMVGNIKVPSVVMGRTRWVLIRHIRQRMMGIISELWEVSAGAPYI